MLNLIKTKMAALNSVVVLLCLFCGAYCQSEFETNVVDALSSWADEKQDEIYDDAVSKLLQQQLGDTSVDWSNTGIEIGDVDTDSDDVIILNLAENELVGGCSHGDCNFCKEIKEKKLHLDSKLLKLGFELKVTANDHELIDKKITVADPPPVCVDAPFVKKACVEVYNVDLKNKSGCVRVIFKVKVGPFKKDINVNIACFKFKDDGAPRLNFIQLLQKLANRQTNHLL